MIRLDIYVDNELVIPFTIETDGFNEDYIRGYDKLIELLPFSPVVIDLNEFNYIPEIGDLWDGEKFRSILNKEFVKIDARVSARNIFLAFVKNDRVVWIMSFSNNDKHRGLKAALLSNPVIKNGA